MLRLGVCGTAACVVFGNILLRVHHFSFDMGPDAIRIFIGYVFVIAMSGPIGVAVGFIVRAQLWSILVLIVRRRCSNRASFTSSPTLAGGFLGVSRRPLCPIPLSFNGCRSSQASAF